MIPVILVAHFIFHPVMVVIVISDGAFNVSVDSTLSVAYRSCIRKGYMKDDYVHLFVRRPVRRSPIINRGNDVYI